MKKSGFARFPKPTYATIQHGLLKVLVERKVGRNGLAVMIALCSCIYANGKLGVASSERIQEITGLNAVQVMHGIKELRDKEIVHTVTRKLKSGAMKADRSMPGHVAQYEFTRDVWARIELESYSKAE